MPSLALHNRVVEYELQECFGTPYISLNQSRFLNEHEMILAVRECQRRHRGVRITWDLDGDYEEEFVPPPGSMVRPCFFLNDMDAFSTWHGTRGFVIDKIAPVGQHGGFFGPSKDCKTWSIDNAAISIATGTPFLNTYKTKQSVVALFCAEGGEREMESRLRRICRSKGISWSGLWETLYPHAFMPRIGDDFVLDAVTRELEEKQVEVAIFDSIYGKIDSDVRSVNSSDIHDQGAALTRISDAMRSIGVTLIISHHMTKPAGDKFTPASLSDISGSAFGPWARFWLLQRRRRPYAFDGRHALWGTIGHSGGQGELVAIDIEETTFSATMSVQSAEAAKEAKVEAAKARKSASTQAAHNRVLEALDDFPEGETANRLRELCKMGGKRFNSIAAAMESEGRIQRVQIVKGNKSHEGWKLVQPDTRTHPDKK